MDGAALLYGEFGKAEQEDFGAGVLELDGGFGIHSCAFDGLHGAATKTLMKDGSANPYAIDH